MPCSCPPPSSSALKKPSLGGREGGRTKARALRGRIRSVRTAIPRLHDPQFQNSAASGFLCPLRFTAVFLKREHLLDGCKAVSNRVGPVSGAHLREYVANSLYGRTHGVIAVNDHGNLAQFLDHRLDEVRIVRGYQHEARFPSPGAHALYNLRS